MHTYIHAYTAVPMKKVQYQVSAKHTIFHYFFLYRCVYVDFATIFTECRVLSLRADFRTEELRLLMAYKLGPSTEA